MTDEEFGAVVGEAEGRDPWARDVVSRWLAGKRVPRRATRATLARLVGLTLDEFDAWVPDAEGAKAGDDQGSWLDATLRRQLKRHLSALGRAGATRTELWAAEQLLTHEAIRRFAAGGAGHQHVRDPAGSGRARRGIPDGLVPRLWGAIVAELLGHLRSR